MIRKLGVKWILTPPGYGAPVEGLKKLYDGEDASIYRLDDGLPVVRWLGTGDTDEDLEIGLRVDERLPGYWLISWDSPVEKTLVVAETWDRGWRARLGHGPGGWFTPEVADRVPMGIHVGPGSGQLELSYIPYGLIPGVIISLAGLSLLVISAFISYGEQRRFTR